LSAALHSANELSHFQFPAQTGAPDYPLKDPKYIIELMHKADMSRLKSVKMKEWTAFNCLIHELKWDGMGPPRSGIISCSHH
jgi:hypothetical protein